MSRGFVKEDDQEITPIVPPRADLPNGVTNYVTPSGKDELIREKQELTHQIETLTIEDEKEQRIMNNFLHAKLQLLNERISTAQVVDLSTQPIDEVRFGATVTIKEGNKKKFQIYQIVGVDEAKVSRGKISFISPIAKILINKKIGDKAILKLDRVKRVFEIVDIQYL